MKDSFKNYFLNKSNQYCYYKSEYVRLKRDISKLETDLKDLNIKIEEKTRYNIQLKQDVLKLGKNVGRLNDYVARLENDLSKFTYNSGEHPPGHFYSPINDHDFLKNREDKIWELNEIKDKEFIEENPQFIEGIELNKEEQIDLLKSFAQFYSEMPFKYKKQPDLRYYFENGFYEEMDGIILYSMIRKLKPKKIIEIGSGFSSALMMDVNNLFFENKIKLTFIEPYPERLYSLMSEKDKIKNKVISEIVQDVNLKIFHELESNDILFIDSSHVVKTGSDIQHILFKILPKLKNGVYIHFHDIFYPFEYPKQWILNNRWNWNEQYFLISFLMYNKQFKIVLLTHYLHEYYKKLFDDMVHFTNHRYNGGSFWIKKS